MSKKSDNSPTQSELDGTRDPHLLDWFRAPTPPGKVNAVIISNIRPHAKPPGASKKRPNTK